MNSNDLVTTVQHYLQQMTAPIRTDHKWVYNRIKLFSSYCMILGLASIVVQIAALVMYDASSLYDYASFGADVPHGIWAGSLYVISGGLGIASAQKRTRSLLVSTVVFSSLSIESSIIASTLSGLAASQSWLTSQWTLMGISILASISSIILLVLASISICYSGRNENTIGSQQAVDDVEPGMGQHPIYFHHQPMQLSAQQLYQPNFQAFYAISNPQTGSPPSSPPPHYSTVSNFQAFYAISSPQTGSPPSSPPPHYSTVSAIASNEVCSGFSTCITYPVA